jgi:dihydrofolate synthase/folylpolyglutamate synthase
MISEITKTGLFRSIVTTQVGGPRQAPAQTLAELFRQGGAANTVAEPDPEAALRHAFRKKGEDGILFCVGSLYLVGMIKALNGGKSDDRL